jgi:hypothetical protein
LIEEIAERIGRQNKTKKMVAWWVNSNFLSGSRLMLSLWGRKKLITLAKS